MTIAASLWALWFASIQRQRGPRNSWERRCAARSDGVTRSPWSLTGLSGTQISACRPREMETHHGQTRSERPVSSSSRTTLLLVDVFTKRSNCKASAILQSRLRIGGMFVSLIYILYFIPGCPLDFTYIHDASLRISPTTKTFPS